MIKNKGRIIKEIKFKETNYEKKKCPYCGYVTINNTDEVIVDICEVCYWQYDEVSEEKPNEIIGPNRVSLNTARKNYKLFGASEECFKI
ncbi:Cysteine-rich CPCC [Fusobacterium necrophorum]|uniref:Cysteine-rich CPCC domain-containing protein n=1 Tax=Fusobacterium necrophorum BL TaxID=1441732 RepID=A0AB73BY25_9FUSO|nr:CPCC family cysteine-rich protein [Fusobacterium necrophorum]KDE64604.1 hypothetical protein FUSO3_02490 [Fusobacterium necrophorum BL]SDB21380.1 Cysteine-rich CPCC [Fusobacterium necrophorum]SQD09601.1 Uncharacterised protein [Fusobacterium necrophorum subsp. necrophorum]